MTMTVKFCLSYDTLKRDFISFKMKNISRRKGIVDTNVDNDFTCNGWMDDLRFYVLLNSISVISGRCLDDNERLCAMKLRLRLRRFHLE